MEMDDTENTTVKPKGPPQEDFPWPHFASLAMHNLISHWDLQPASKTMQDVTSGKIPTKVNIYFVLYISKLEIFYIQISACYNFNLVYYFWVYK